MKAIAAVVMAIGVACMAGAADDGSRPPGVRAQNWIRVGDRLGFVLTASDGPPVRGQYAARILLAAPENVAADLMPPAKGYLVIQTPTGWRRINVSDPTDLTR